MIILKKDSSTMVKGCRICFLADRHDLYDDRIYWKMAAPLSKMGYEVHYLLIDKTEGAGTTAEGVHFKKFQVKTFSKNRFLNFFLKRMNPSNNYKSMYKMAAGLKADIYHFHDLWINRFAPKLKLLAHRPIVFYDAREPYAEDYKSYVKTPFPLILKLFTSWIDRWEKRQAKVYDLVIANEAKVRQNFAKIVGEERSVVIHNYYNLTEAQESIPIDQRQYDLIYTGAISELRGAFEILKAVKMVKEELPEVKALLVGKYYPISLKMELYQYIKDNGLLKNIELKEAVPFNQVAKYYMDSKIGIVLLHNVPTFKISMPIKLFEYMAFGLPVVGSNFGHIKDYILNDNCGLVVGPHDTKAAATAILKILKDPTTYDCFSENGKLATKNKYQWDKEFEKLLRYYNTALNERR